MFLSAGHRGDHVGAAAPLPVLPPGAKGLATDRGHDADWLRWGLADSGIAARIPARRCRKKAAAPHDPALHRQRHRIENAFARLKDWRRIATRYDPLSRPLPLGLRLGHRGVVPVVSPEPRAC